MTTLREKHLRWKTPAITNVMKMLNLTLAGTIELTQFPDEVINQATKDMRCIYKGPRKTIDNPFIYFLKVCHNICKNKAILRNALFTKSLKIEFGITPDMDLVEQDLDALEELDPFDEENEEKIKKSQKRDSRIWSSSLNAQASYRKHSGERPSLATPIDVKATFVDQFDGKKIVDNAFTRSIYAIFKQIPLLNEE